MKRQASLLQDVRENPAQLSQEMVCRTSVGVGFGFKSAAVTLAQVPVFWRNREFQTLVLVD